MLQGCIDSMDPNSHADSVQLNIFTGAVPPQDVNVDRAMTFGQEQMEALESSWLEGFYNTIKQQVVTFPGNRKAIKFGDVTVIDQEAINFLCQSDWPDGKPARCGFWTRAQL